MIIDEDEDKMTMLVAKVTRRPQDGGDGLGVVGGEGKGGGGDSDHNHGGRDDSDNDGDDNENYVDNDFYHKNDQARSVLPAVLNVLDKHNIDGCNKVIIS